MHLPREEKKERLNQIIAQSQPNNPHLLQRAHEIQETSTQQLIQSLAHEYPGMLHIQHIQDQLDSAKQALDFGIVQQLPHHFDRTIRDSQLYHTNRASSRYQLMFSPLDKKITPFITPLHDTPEHDAQAIQASIYDWKKIPIQLVQAFCKRYETQHWLPETKREFMQELNKPHHHARLSTYLMRDPAFMESFKSYLAQGKGLTYINAPIETPEQGDGLYSLTTPRVIELPDNNILLIQHADRHYTEAHLKRYRGTHYFLQLFGSKASYQKAERKLLEKLSHDPERDTLFSNWLHSDIRIDTELLKKEIAQAYSRFFDNLNEWETVFSRHHTRTDQQLAGICHKMQQSKNSTHLMNRRDEALRCLQEGESTRERQQKIIQEQVIQG